MTSNKKHVFIIGLDPFNKRKLESQPLGELCEFHPALQYEDVRTDREFDIDALIDQAIRDIESSGYPVDGIFTFWDFPCTTMLPVLCENFDVPGPSLEAVLACEHKYWSRLTQQRVIPTMIPRFQAFDPFDDDAFEKLELVTPFWIKPIKSFRSFLAYRINGPREFEAAMEEVRASIGYMTEPFQRLMERYEMPDEFTHMTETMIAEGTIGGAQATLEAYVYNGEVIGYGVVDSVREGDRSSFARYEYPSTLPLEVNHRMIDSARRAMSEIGFNNGCFNAEFFYDATADAVYLLEINPRLSQSHADIFEKIHGVSHLSVGLQVALGLKPKPLEKKGAFNVAGNFMLRAFSDGVVRSIPSEEQIQDVKARFPGTEIQLKVKPGVTLSEMKGQDSYSYEVATAFIGGRDQQDLVEKYDAVLKSLPFKIERTLEVPIF